MDIRPRTRRKRVATLGLVLSTALLVGPGAGAVSAFNLLGPQEPVKGAPDPYEVAARTYAEQARIPVARAREALELQSAVGDIGGDVAKAAGESYAGMWFDPEKLVFHALVADDDHAKVEAALARKDLAARSEVTTVEHSLRELEAAQLELYRSSEESFRLAAIGSTLDIPGNRVVLRVADNAADHVRSAASRRARAAAVDTAVDVVPQRALRGETNACGLSPSYPPGFNGYPHCSRPLRAGVQQQPQGCTFAGLAYANALQKYMVTAGHCSSYIWNYAVNHNDGYSYRVGTGSQLGMFDWRGDVHLVNAQGEWWDIVGWVPRLAWWGYDGGVLIMGQGQAYVGQWLWKEGVSSGTFGGPITELGRWVNYSGVQVGGQVVVRTCSLGGDSGGPWWVNNTIYGVHSGRSSWSGESACDPVNDETYHTEARNISLHLGSHFASAG